MDSYIGSMLSQGIRRLPYKFSEFIAQRKPDVFKELVIVLHGVIAIWSCG